MDPSHPGGARPFPRTDDRPAVGALLTAIKRDQEVLDQLIEETTGHWGYEDPVYRFWHQSMKVYAIQGLTGDWWRHCAPCRPMATSSTRGSSRSSGKARAGRSRWRTTRDGWRSHAPWWRRSSTPGSWSRWPRATATSWTNSCAAPVGLGGAAAPVRPSIAAGGRAVKPDLARAQTHRARGSGLPDQARRRCSAWISGRGRPRRSG